MNYHSITFVHKTSAVTKVQNKTSIFYFVGSVLF